MGLSVGQQARWWGGGFIAFIAFLWLVNDAVAPFLLGAAFAYLLDPIADKLESWGMGRTWATVLISVVALIFMLLALVLLVPLIFRQVSSLIETSPQLVASLLDFLTEKFPSLLQEDSSVRQALSSVEDTLRSKGIAVANTVLASSLAAVSSVLTIFVSLVVAFYLLLDWDRMTAVVDSWMPRQHVGVIREIGREIDQVLACFIRGQMTVGAILGIFYAVALAIVGLQFGVVIGLLAGALTFIPYVGSTVGGTVSIGLAIYQFWDDPVWIAVVAAIFVTGQIVEGNYLTPKLVGSSVGLHPVWLMFALYAFGSLIGFTGLLIAVPAAACIGVLGRFGIKNYRDSRLYLGPEEETEGE